MFVYKVLSDPRGGVVMSCGVGTPCHQSEAEKL